ncbi:unnamed protein product [Ambrosiozyma monospora]|uniref:Unnamed protein product n=1 Tax=Ambrosiozyma monospora TaxID=43982 RepID=A0A9W7DCT1_AMBMO|nr:unnamed protein product [Ambrosiozyma monospora]
MTVAIQSNSPYPVPLKKNGLIESYKENSPTHVIPQKTIDLEVASLLKRIESTPGFDPTVKFDAKKHIIFKEEYCSPEVTKQFTLKDLKITKTHVPPLSDFGAAFPFPLISEEAVNIMLWEGFQPHVLEKWARLPNLATGANRLDFHIGGHARSEAPFSWAFFNSPELSEIVSKFCGFKARPLYNSEVCHFNVSLATEDPEIAATYPKTKEEIDAILAKQDAGDGDAIPSSLGLHYDSSSLALVIMMDLPKEAVGGQTTIVTGDEKSRRVPEPTIGSATIIQGRVLKHLASKPVTNHNRITCVAGMAIAPPILDNTALTSVKPSVMSRARYDTFYSDWTTYRFENLELRLKYLREKLVKRYEDGEKFNQEEVIGWCEEMEEYLHKTWDEMEAVHNPPYPSKHFSTPYDEY